MNKFTFDLSFRIRHPYMDAATICTQLGMKAKYSWMAGTQRKTPKGDLLDGLYPETYCTFCLAHDEETCLGDLIRLNNHRLRSHADFLKEINSTGGKLEYFIGWYSSGNSGEEFHADLIQELADLQIGLSLDFYGGE